MFPLKKISFMRLKSLWNCGNFMTANSGSALCPDLNYERKPINSRTILRAAFAVSIRIDSPGHLVVFTWIG